MLEGTYTLSLTEEEVKEMGGLDKVPTLTLRKDGSWEMTAPPEKPMTGKYALNGENLTLTATDGEDQRLIVGDGGKTITEAVEDQPATFVLDKDKK